METGFSISVNGGTLRGVAHLPVAEHCPCLILCHGLTGDAHERTLIKIARCLEQHQVACIRLDCMGSGDSDGESAQATTSTEAADILAVSEYARSLPQVDPDRIALGGHSLGAMAVLMEADRCAAAGIVLLSPALSCYHELIQMLTGERLHDFLKRGVLDLGGFEVSRAMVDELSDVDGYQLACKLALPTLLIHGELDDESPVYHSIRLKDKLGDLAELNIVPGVHHCYETADAQATVARLTAEFMVKLQKNGGKRS